MVPNSLVVDASVADTFKKHKNLATCKNYCVRKVLILGLSTMPSTTWNNLQNHILAWEGVGGGGLNPPDISRKLCQNDYKFFFFCFATIMFKFCDV